MAASISMAGNSAMAAKSLSPTKLEISVMVNVVPKKMSAHIKPNTKNARQLLRHATVLKNKPLLTGTACQWVNAGACQNTSDKGKYNINDSHMAF